MSRLARQPQDDVAVPLALARAHGGPSNGRGQPKVRRKPSLVITSLSGDLGALATGGATIPASAALTAGTLGARAAANRMTSSAVDRLGNIIRSGGSAPMTIAPMGPRVTSPLAALLMGSGVNAVQPAQPYATGLGAAFAQ